MYNRAGSLAIALAAMLAAASVNARAWRVELNGSGDFTDIQPAVDASAAGDTVVIGPGRFATFRPVVAPAWTEEAVIWVNKDNLTFIGSGRDVTIIGPTTYYGALQDNPMGFCIVSPIEVTIKNLTIENIETSVYWDLGQFEIENCRLAGDGFDFKGLITWASHGSVRNCRFETSVGGIGCILASGARDIELSNCEFFGRGYGVQAVGGAQNIVVTSSQFDRSVCGVTFFEQATGAVADCRMTNIQVTGISLYDNCVANVERVTISARERGFYVVGGSRLTGTDVVIENTTVESLLLCCNSIVTLNNSHILPSSGMAVRCDATWTNVHSLDLTGNYWGTTDAQVIRDMIWDAGDAPAINCAVQFEPFANGPVPTESTTWGDLKAQFR